MEHAEYTSHYLLDTRPWPRRKCRRGFLYFMAIHYLPSWEFTSAFILSSMCSSKIARDDAETSTVARRGARGIIIRVLNMLNPRKFERCPY